MTTKQNPEMWMFIGTYTRREPQVSSGKSEGIYVYRFDASTGAMTYASTTAGVVNPSYLVVGPRRRYLYAVNEVEDFGGNSSGAVSAFTVDQQTGALSLLNQQPTQGAAPCYLTVDATGRYVLAANYGGGSVCVLPIQDDGSLGPATDFIQHEGSSMNPQRQAGPHAHSITLDPRTGMPLRPIWGWIKS